MIQCRCSWAFAASHLMRYPTHPASSSSRSRNARRWKDWEGAAACPSCSQNAHGETVLARVEGASRRAQGGWVRKLRAVKGSLDHSLNERNRGLECPRSGEWHVTGNLLKAIAGGRMEKHRSVRGRVRKPREVGGQS